MTDGLSTCYWFDTVSQSITSVFRCRKYGDHVSATDFDRNGYRPIFGDQGGDALFFSIVSQVVIAAGMAQKQLVYELLTIGCSTCWRVTS